VHLAASPGLKSPHKASPPAIADNAGESFTFFSANFAGLHLGQIHQQPMATRKTTGERRRWPLYDAIKPESTHLEAARLSKSRFVNAKFRLRTSHIPVKPDKILSFKVLGRLIYMNTGLV
jgi:hypothetical protein